MPADTPATPACPSCSLTGDALGDRVTAWRDITGQALEHTRAHGRLVSTYPAQPGIAARLAELVAAEGECCPFLEFDLREREGEISLEMRYPPEFAGMVDEILAGDQARA